MKKLIIFTILIIAVSSFADEWKPDEWLISKSIKLSLTSAEKEEEVFENFYKKVIAALPKKIEAKNQAEIITQFGTSEWKIVPPVKEYPYFKSAVPEYSVTFAARYWISSEKQEGELLFISDDAVKVWQNGQEIYEYPHNSSIHAVPVLLNKGTNVFVFAIINSTGVGMIGADLHSTKSDLIPKLNFDIKQALEKWEPEEWLISKPINLELVDSEKGGMNKTKKEANIAYEKFYERIITALPKKYETKPQSIIVTSYGTTIWKRVPPVGENPLLMKIIPECSVMFAAKYWISSKKQEAELRFGSDDAAKIWQNNNEIFSYPYNSGFVSDKHTVKVTLKKGTNVFVFAVVNGSGIGTIGAHLYPKKSAVYPGLYFDTRGPVETGKYINVDFYWMPVINSNPIKRVYNNRVILKEIKLLDFAGNVVTQIADDEIALPQQINMCGKSNGIYKIESKWGGKIHTRLFYYGGFLDNPSITEKWKMNVLCDNDFFLPGALLYQIIDPYKTSLIRIRAYKSKYDNTFQPYVIIIPKNKIIKKGLPLIVRLRDFLLLNKILFTKKTAAFPNNMMQVCVYARGDSGFKGLSERDVFDVIELVCEEYKIDRNRIYLLGNSLGGHGCWLLGGRHPDKFAAAVPDGGYTFEYADNFLSLPLLQLWSKPSNPGYVLQQVINHLHNEGANASYYDLRNLTGNKKNDKIQKPQKIEQWLKGKKRNLHPDKVSYSTYGDVDGAYWVRNIMPEWFGRLGMVEAEVIGKVISNRYSVFSENAKNIEQSTNCGIIQVKTENVSNFSLDLRKGRFLKFKNWDIVIDDKIKTNVISGEMFSFEIQSKIRNLKSKIKKNGFCGGICDVVCDSFIFAYSAKDEKAKERAIKFNKTITGIGSKQFDGNFKVIPDTELTKEICEKYNVILFTSNEKSGMFLKENIDKLPFGMLEGHLVFNSAKKVAEEPGIRGSRGDPPKDNLAFVYPNPLVSNRYLLTVTMTNFTPLILIYEHNDIILGSRRGSFDKNWDKIQWQDEFQPRKHVHDHNCSECDDQHDTHLENMPLEKEISSNSKRKPWKTYGMILCFLGMAVFYGYDYFAKKKKGL